MRISLDVDGLSLEKSINISGEIVSHLKTYHNIVVAEELNSLAKDIIYEMCKKFKTN